MRYLSVIICVLFFGLTFGNPKSTKPKVTTPKTIKPSVQKIPLPLLVQVLDSIDKFVINDQTKFAHIDVPVSKYGMFISYIKDSVAVEIPGLQSPVYYNFNLKNGKIVNGDIYWNDKKAYIIFNIDGKKYVNVFTTEGAQQLKSVFKL